MNAADKPLGLMFQEKMAGPFALGETDPEAGAEKGKTDRTVMTLHGAITIEDLDRFLTEPDHTGQLNGRIDFPPLGSDLVATEGIFNLFRPTDDPEMKYMVYELGFVVNGRCLYLAGRKEVREAPVTDLWKATTTLYTVIHEGSDKAGPVIGAGILTLGLADLIAMIPTMKAIHSKTAEQTASTLARFGRFFLGELWDIYVRHASP